MSEVVWVRVTEVVWAAIVSFLGRAAGDKVPAYSVYIFTRWRQDDGCVWNGENWDPVACLRGLEEGVDRNEFLR